VIPIVNRQPIEKRNFREDGYIEVHSIFNTIQGEGPFAGQQAVFVRLAGCNLQCPACDTDYTEGRTLAEPAQIVAKVHSFCGPNDLVVITGGEPFRQNISNLVRLLMNDGYRVQIETNGTLGAPDSSFYRLVETDITRPDGCFIVCSPKTGKIDKDLDRHICAFKYIIRDGEVDIDGLPLQALGHTASPFVHRPDNFNGPIYVQPCDDQDIVKNKRNLEACIRSVLKYGFTLQLQIHKIINME
jgi:organic radical activating enzyme